MYFIDSQGLFVERERRNGIENKREKNNNRNNNKGKKKQDSQKPPFFQSSKMRQTHAMMRCVWCV
jgi:hypothetical protein